MKQLYHGFVNIASAVIVLRMQGKSCFAKGLP